MLQKYDRVAIVGGPQVGKTTISRRIKDRPVLHSDDFKHLDWSAASQEMAERANAVKGKVAVEGVAAARAIRKGMRVDAILVLQEPVVKQLKPGQATMTKGVHTVLAEVRKMFPDLPVLTAPPPPVWDKDDDEEE